MKHVNMPEAKATFDETDTLYEAHGTSDSVVLVADEEMHPINAWAKLVNSDYIPETCPRCGVNVDDEPDLVMVGAHVLKYKKIENIKKGEPCYIIPLCNRCNSTSFPKGFKLHRTVNALEVLF